MTRSERPSGPYDQGAYDGLRVLLESAHFAEPDQLPGLVDEAYRRVGAESAVLYLVDYDQTAVAPLGHRPWTESEVIPLDGTLAGRAYTEVRSVVEEHPTNADVWTPLLDGTDRLGLLRARFTSAVSDQVVDACRLLAALVSELTVVRSRYGDNIERCRRHLPMTVPAELQWRQVAPLTLVTDRVAISAVLSPTYAVAGDTFDYAVNGDLAQFAVFDAMGHGLEAALMATVASMTFRNARLTGLDLVESARAIDKLVTAQFGVDRFVTGVLAELDLQDGTYRWLNAGHPPVLLVRGARVVDALDQRQNAPFGVLGEGPRLATARIEPGDRILCYSDGVVEARTPDGEMFGVDRLVEFVSRHEGQGLAAAETMRRLNQAIIEHHAGVLDDDATTLMVNWLGPHPHR